MYFTLAETDMVQPQQLATALALSCTCTIQGMLY